MAVISLPVEAVTTAETVSEREITAELFSDNTYSELIESDTKITLKGILPDDAQVRAYPTVTSLDDIDAIAAFDITIFESDGVTVYEPDENSIAVTFTMPELSEYNAGELSVAHIGDDGSTELIGDTVLQEDTLTFETDSFSVYVIYPHEDDILETPRVNIHFISQNHTESQVTDDNGVTAIEYQAEPYYFLNKAGEYQTTQIVKDGETLEQITNPPNTDEQYFYGWYVVNVKSTEDGVISYTWPDDPYRLVFESAFTVTNDGDTISWTINEKTYSGTSNENGCADVYVAPLYRNYHFLNFHLGAVDAGDISSNILTRRLIALGAGQSSAYYRIGNITAKSTDPKHKVFIGWETGGVIYTTIDENGGEIISDKPENADGYYLEIKGSELEHETNIDLYPVFTEARWINYNTGVGGNGASYVPAQFLRTSDEYPHCLEQLAVSSRSGYKFMGWYTEPDRGNGDQGQQITDEKGYFVDDYTAAGKDGDTLYEIKDHKFYIYRAAEDTTLYAKWQAEDNTSFSLIVWKQKITDSADITDDSEKTYDYEKSAVIPCRSGSTSDDLKSYISSYENESYQGFHFSRTEMSSPTVDSNGTTIVNVYYDRDVIMMTFMLNGSKNGGYQIAASDSTSPQQYGYVNGEYVELTRNSEITYSGTYYKYTVTSDYTDGYYYVFDNGQYKSQYLYYNDGKWYKTRTRLGPFRYQYSDEYTGTVYKRDPFTYTGALYVKNGDTYTVTNTIGSSTYYGYDSEAGYVQLYNIGSSSSYYWTYGEGRRYDGTRYVKITNNTRKWYVDKIFTGLYGQTLAQCGYKWPDEKSWYDRYSGTSATGTQITFIDRFTENVTYYGADAAGGNYYIRHYKQNVDGSWPDKDNYANFSANSGNTTFTFTEKYTGFTMKYYYLGNDNNYQNWWDSTWNSDKKSQENSSAENEYTVNINKNSLFIRYERNTYQLTFNMNYPDFVTVSSGESADKIYDVKYEAALSGYKTDGSELNAPDHYYFAGWYEDDKGEKLFDFNSAMPAANKVIYACWKPVTFRVEIDPNGAEIDHINHYSASSGVGWTYDDYGINGFRQDDSGYDRSKATYFDAVYGETISEYALSRDYVEISDTQAAQMDKNEVYYYLNTQYQSYDGNGLPTDLRNALYITEDEIDRYYEFYKSAVNYDQGRTEGLHEPLPKALWRSLYVSKEKYRRLYDNENYTFLGWFAVDDKGNISDMPYDFTAPVTGPLKLKAGWRLDGGYTIQYIPLYWTDDNVLINGDLEQWSDPENNESYADSAKTVALRQPTGIRKDGQPTDSYIFRGWRIVSITQGNGSRLIYTPLENGVYYEPGEVFYVQAKYADSNGIIYMQAVYEEKDASYRRPYITDLTLDANSDKGGYIDESAGTPVWNGVGEVRLNKADEQINFSSIQSNTAIHLYQYAVNGELGSGKTGTNYFKHSKGYLLLGFDDEKNDGDFIADYAADSVISVQRTDNETIYAVWEPMVYLNLVNDTEVGDVTFGLSSTSAQTLYIVNEKVSAYDRVAVSDIGNITLKEGETLRLAIPYGENSDITISGMNKLGTGYTLYLNSGLNGTQRQSADAKNTKPFSLTDTLEIDSTGVTVTFTAEKSDRTIVLDDNYEGGGTQELYFSDTDTAAALPTTRTRIGYELLGWDIDKDKTFSPMFDTTGQTASNIIEDMNAFFGTYDTDEDNVITLYAVWKSNAKANEVYVYKQVPEPGDKTKEFTFTVSLSGTYGSSGNITNQKVNCDLKDGEYLFIRSTKETGKNAYVKVEIEKHDADGNIAKEQLIWNNPDSRNTVNNINEIIAVAEKDYSSEFYSASIDITVQTENLLNKDDDSRTVTWKNAQAGGYVVFTNTRQTADVTITKELVDTLDPTASFRFSASATVDGKVYSLGSSDISFKLGDGGTHTISALPIGAELTITEEANTDYAISASSDSGTADKNDADNIISFTVPKDGDSIRFRNVRKSVKAKIVKTDENGNALDSAVFNISNIGNELYSKENTGIIYDGTLYYGRYTITETLSPTGYALLSPFTLTISDNDGTPQITSTAPDAVSVSKEDDTYIIKVKNELAYQTVRIRKVDKNGKLITGGTAGFKLSGTTTIHKHSTERSFSTSGGVFNLEKLSYGTYTLTETRAPSGYKIGNAEPITISVTSTGVSISGNDDAVLSYSDTLGLYIISVKNEPMNPAPTGMKHRAAPYVFLVIPIAVPAVIWIYKRREVDSDAL